MERNDAGYIIGAYPCAPSFHQKSEQEGPNKRMVAEGAAGQAALRRLVSLPLHDNHAPSFAGKSHLNFTSDLACIFALYLLQIYIKGLCAHGDDIARL